MAKQPSRKQPISASEREARIAARKEERRQARIEQRRKARLAARRGESAPGMGGAARITREMVSAGIAALRGERSLAGAKADDLERMCRAVYRAMSSEA